METSLVPDRKNLLEHESKEQRAAGAEEDIVRLEKRRELGRLAVLLECLNSEDRGEVRDEGDCHRLVGGKGGFARDIFVQMGGETVGHSGQDKVSEASHGHVEEGTEDLSAQKFEVSSVKHSLSHAFTHVFFYNVRIIPALPAPNEQWTKVDEKDQGGAVTHRRGHDIIYRVLCHANKYTVR